MKNNKDSFYTSFSIFGLIVFLFLVLPIGIHDSSNTDGHEKTNNKIYNTTSYTFYDYDYDYDSLPSLDFSIPELISSEIPSYQPPKEETEIIVEENELIVYVTDYGSKYHKITCGSLYKSLYPISLNEAWENGYTPCKRCNPPLPEFN